MAELVEYTFVVLVSALFVGGSVATYAGFSSFSSGLQLRLASSSIGKLAEQAVSDGGASMSLSLPTSTITCQGGVLTLASPGFAQSQQIPAACDFRIDVTGGLHTIRFSYGKAGLTAEET